MPLLPPLLPPPPPNIGQMSLVWLKMKLFNDTKLIKLRHLLVFESRKAVQLLKALQEVFGWFNVILLLWYRSILLPVSIVSCWDKNFINHRTMLFGNFIHLHFAYGQLAPCARIPHRFFPVLPKMAEHKQDCNPWWWRVKQSEKNKEIKFRRGNNLFQNIRQRRERNGGETFRLLRGFINLRLKKPLRGRNASPPFLFRLCLTFWKRISAHTEVTKKSSVHARDRLLEFSQVRSTYARYIVTRKLHSKIKFSDLVGFFRRAWWWRSMVKIRTGTRSNSRPKKAKISGDYDGASIASPVPGVRNSRMHYGLEFNWV